MNKEKTHSRTMLSGDRDGKNFKIEIMKINWVYVIKFIW